MTTALMALGSVAARVAPLRRGGWLLIAASLSFFVALAYIIAAGADVNRELQEAAEAAGTTIGTIPVDEQARIAARYPTFSVVSGLLLLVPSALLLAALHGVRGALRPTDGAGLARAAWWLGLVALLVWYSFDLLTLGLLAGPGRLPPLVDQLDRLYVPLVSAAALLGLGAVLCAGLAARRVRIAPRTALGAVIVAGLLLVLGLAITVGSGFAMDLPPIAPMLPALILGIGLVRAKAT